MTYDNFVSIANSVDNLDLYIVRNSILRTLRNALDSFKGDFLDVGCGRMPYRELILGESQVRNYVGLDIDTALNYDGKVQPDARWDGITMPFADQTFDSAMATEVLEHCSNPRIVLGEVYRVLRPGGTFFFTTPFLWNLHEVPHDEFRLTPFHLDRLFREIGYSQISLSAMGGWHASLAQMLGLWVRRGPIRKKYRRYLSYLLRPIVLHLYKKDQKRNVQFKEGSMITGIYGIVKK